MEKRKVVKGTTLVLWLVISSLLMTGCLGSREIDDLAMVMAVGLDKGKEPGTIKVTAQIARPGDVRGQTGAPTAGTGQPIWTASAEGRSIFEAIRNLARYSSRRVFWAHNQVIVINEEVAREGVSEIIDFFSRNHELRMRTWVVVTEDEASHLITTKTGLEVIPGVSMDKLFRYSEIVAEAPRTDMRTLQAAYLSRTTHPVLARVSPKNRQISAKANGEFGSNPQVELSGTAVFNRDKMVGWLSTKESHGLLWFVEHVESRVITLPCAGQRERSSTLEMKNAKFQVKPVYEKGKVEFDVRVKAMIDLVELGCPDVEDQYVWMQQAEKEAADLLRGEIESVLEAAQKRYHVDFLELGKVFENHYPAEWRQMAQSWDDAFEKAQVRVTVEANINSPVLLHKATKSRK
ncbi:Ger(x)C family spore germination protein [Tumebacillus sp. DT12]|uniref:Ger(X)C family spore germination protein n=1 Tax=Tumebacillus lacus TaxID=2995335 RepID=A0ABT3X2N8_9BACL|nr:Ger(x)C family spore germination protein [Tumebacillus lacus]MCX7571172.1 Ger(x)C family spore germination protein [Tumebacillus lacus]